MRVLLFILILSLPALAAAQVGAPGFDFKQPTTGLVEGQTDTVYVFYDDHAMTLSARQRNGDLAEFTWKKLNTETHTLDLVRPAESGATSSTLNNISEGGYQVAVRNLVDLSAPIDTFTTWVFRDTFRIDSVRHRIDCDVLQLNMFTTPYIYENYTIYNFKQALTPPYTGETVFNQVQEIKWTPVDDAGSEVDIFPEVSDADENWRTRLAWLTYIDSPPPLRDAAYKLEITDVFGKQATHTTPYTIEAISVYAQPAVEMLEKDGNWKDAGEEPKGEALFEVRFLHNKSVNAGKYKWKGFADKNQPNGDKTLVWTDSTTNADDYIYPRMPYRGQVLPGYTPGTYQARLIVNNNTCTDSASVYIAVDPSKFAAEAVPNAFTPNGDGMNDIFSFVTGNEPVSMEFIHVHIYNRSGGLVYRYEGRADEWNGWNGRMSGTGSDVAEGVYYYIITGRGWDDINYDSKEFSGYLHLFR